MQQQENVVISYLQRFSVISLPSVHVFGRFTNRPPHSSSGIGLCNPSAPPLRSATATPRPRAVPPRHQRCRRTACQRCKGRHPVAAPGSEPVVMGKPAPTLHCACRSWPFRPRAESGSCVRAILWGVWAAMYFTIGSAIASVLPEVGLAAGWSLQRGIFLPAALSLTRRDHIKVEQPRDAAGCHAK